MKLYIYFFSFFSNFVNLYEIDLSYNNITDNGVINFSAVINDLIDNISFIDISNNKLSDTLNAFWENWEFLSMLSIENILIIFLNY